MLHVILLILKIIGWILLVILGLIVLLICVMLFTPLHYHIQAACAGKLSTLDVRADFTVFFHLVRAQIRYQDEKINWNARIAWKKLNNEALEAGEEIAEEKAGNQPERKTDDPAEDQTGNRVENPSENQIESRTEDHPENPSEDQEKTLPELPAEDHPGDIDSSEVSETPPVLPAADAESSHEEQEPVSSKTSVFLEEGKPKTEDRSSAPRIPKKNSGGAGAKIHGFFEKIKYTIHRFCDKIKELLRKKEILMDFIKDESHQAALLKGLREIKRLIFRLKPKKLSAEIHFGFEDPAYTGYTLAGISMIYPILGEDLKVQPDFDQKVLEGNLFIKGHIRARIFAAFLVNMILDKNVRKIIRDIKNFSFDA